MKAFKLDKKHYYLYNKTCWDFDGVKAIIDSDSELIRDKLYCTKIEILDKEKFQESLNKFLSEVKRTSIFSLEILSRRDSLIVKCQEPFNEVIFILSKRPPEI